MSIFDSSVSVADYFSRQAFPIFRSAFEQRGVSPPFDVARVFADVLARALVLCGRLQEEARFLYDESTGSWLEEDERIAQFARMLDRAKTIAVSEGSRQLELRHLLPASFEERDVHPVAIANASNRIAADLVAATCLELERLALEKDDVIARIAVRYHVLCTGAGVVDFGNDYESLHDAVRAMRHLQVRAEHRSPGPILDHKTYVFILVPSNLEAVSQIVMQVREAAT